VDYSCYEGVEVPGAVRTVLSRGQVVVDNGELVGRAGHGRFVPRAAASGKLEGGR
jgi:dihydropyrimidinase